MTISSLGLQQIAFSGVANARDNLEAAQVELSSGRRAERYGGLGGDAAQLVTAEALRTRTASAVTAGENALSRLSLVGAGLEAVDGSLAQLEGALSRALANGDGSLVSEAAENAGRGVISALNSRFGDVFVFAGDRADTPPVNGSALSDLTGDQAADFPAGSAFAIVVDDVAVSSGPTAATIGGAVAEQLTALAQAGLGGPLSADAAAQLRGAIQALGALREEIGTARALVGVDENRLDRATSRLAVQRDLAEIVASDIEAGDPAEAITRLNRDQLALEASARALGVLNQASLLNFL